MRMNETVIEPGATRRTAAHWGVSCIDMKDGEIARVTPSPLDPSPSPMIHSLPAVVRGPLRIDRPHVRASYLAHGPGHEQVPRGTDGYCAVSWSTALDLVERALRDTKARFGNEAIFAGCYGWASAGRFHHAPSLLKRFLNLFGGYVDKVGNHSFGAALGIMPYVIGRADIPSMVAPWETLVGSCDLIVLFGGAHLKNAQVEMNGQVRHESESWFHKAHAAGTRFVNISPSRGDLTAAVDGEWISLRPNTDMALMLGLAHTLLAEGLHDTAFLRRYCVGFEPFADYLRGLADGVAKDAAWAAEITTIPADRIVALARRMAASRTLVATAWSVQRADHGEQPVWMTVTLAAMLGQIGLPGGGFSLGFGRGGSAPPRHVPRIAMPVGKNPVSRFVPVACVGDMLLNPGRQIAFNGGRIEYPDIKLIYAAGGNPFHHNTDLNTLLRGWQRADTVIAHEAFWNPLARHADIVLPATTALERNDILAAEAASHWIAMEKVIEPVGQARHDFDIFADLAGRLGFGSEFTQGRDERGWMSWLYEQARSQAIERGFAPPDFAAFWTAGVYAFPEQAAAPQVFLGAFRDDPEASPLKTPSGRIEIFSERIAGFGYADCPAHPAWIEPSEWLGGALARDYPLHLLSNQPAARLHSQLDMSPLSRASKVAGREAITLHPNDAAARGIRDGDVVRVFNARGAFLAGARIGDHLRESVVQIATGAWYQAEQPGVPGSPDTHGNPNMVTMSKPTSSLAGAPTAQTVLVQIERADHPPPMTAFDLPRLEPA